MVCVYPSEFLDASCDQLRRLFAFSFRYLLWMSIFIFILPPFDSGLFLKEFPLCLESGALHYFAFLFYIMNVLAENHEVEEELAMVSKVNTELNNYMALSEKIAEDRERKRIAREIHDTLGHALTGISAGLDAVGVLIDIDPNRAKEQVKAYQKWFVKGSRM